MSAFTASCGDKSSDLLSLKTGGKGSPAKESEIVSSENEVDTVAYLTKDALTDPFEGSGSPRTRECEDLCDVPALNIHVSSEEPFEGSTAGMLSSCC